MSALAAVTALGALIGAHNLGSKSIWGDEAISIQYARGSLRSLGHVVANTDPNMSLYYFLLHFWVRISGEGAAAVRSLSLVFGVLALPAIYLVGERLFGRWAGVVAAALLAVNAYFVIYEQDARAYTLVTLLVILSSYLFLRLIDRSSWGGHIAYVIVSALAVYSHLFAVFVLLVHAGTLICLRRREVLSSAWVATAAALAVLCTPLLVFVMHAGSGSIAWLPSPTFASVHGLFTSWTGGSHVGLALLVGLGALALVPGERPWRARFAAAWFLVPIVLSLVISTVKTIFGYPYVIVSLPGLLLLAAAGAVRLPRRALAVAAVAAVVALPMPGLRHWYNHSWMEDWRGATEFAFARARPGDALAVVPSTARSPVDYYARRWGKSIPPDIAPAGHVVFRLHGRLWLLLDAPSSEDDPSVRALVRELGPGYRVTSTRKFAQLWVLTVARETA